MKNLGWFFLCLGIFATSAALMGKSQRLYGGKPIVAGEVLAKAYAPLSETDLKSLGVEVTLKETINLGTSQVVRLRLDGKDTFESQLSELQKSNLFEYVEPNFIYTLVNLPDDPRAGLLWGLENRGNNEPLQDGGTNQTQGKVGADINALKAWPLTTGSRDIKIAVIDTGVDYNHPDLRENMWVNEAEKNGQPGVDDDGNGYVDDIHGYDFSSNDGDPLDDHSHGTHCAGTIGAVHNNQEGIAGVMAEVTLVAIKFLNESGSGTTADAIKSVQYATHVGVDLMSNSWGGGGYSQALDEAIKMARDAGIVFVAAAGNSRSDNDTDPHYPSNYNLSNVISVAAHNAQESLASFSNWGRSSVHIAAPGRNILSTVIKGGYEVYSGTSMATPHVSGALGLLLAQEGRMEFDELRERLEKTSVPVRAFRRRMTSGGRLDAYNLLTNTRPLRIEPDPNLWQRVELDEAYESSHPYQNNISKNFKISHPGAKYLRLVVKRFELEKGYDFLFLRDGNTDEELESITGQGEDYLTEYVEGDSISVQMVSDFSLNGWGYLIDAYEYIQE